MEPEHRPTIGLTCYWSRAQLNAWGLDAVVASQGYVEGARLAGGRTVVLPPDPVWKDNPDDALGLIDGLLLIGGNDIDPKIYGKEPHQATMPPVERRDQVELALLEAALARDMPILGICRGMHLLNVIHGGTLHQSLSDHIDIRPHRATDTSYGSHALETIPGSIAASVMDGDVDVASHHNQGIDELGEGLLASAWAPDGIIEAVERPDLSFCVGVLWHPDADPSGSGAAIFRRFIEAAEEYVARRATPGRAELVSRSTPAA